MPRRPAARGCRTSLADRYAIASGVPIPTPAPGNLRPTHPSDPSRLEPAASHSPVPGAPGPPEEIFSALSICEKRLKSPLVRPGASASGLSLSDGSMRIELVGWVDWRSPRSVVALGAPVATWSRSV